MQANLGNWHLHFESLHGRSTWHTHSSLSSLRACTSARAVAYASQNDHCEMAELFGAFLLDSATMGDDKDMLYLERRLVMVAGRQSDSRTI